MAFSALKRPFIILVQDEFSKGKVLLSDLFDPRVGVVNYVDALKLEIKYLGEVDVVESVRLVNLVF